MSALPTSEGPAALSEEPLVQVIALLQKALDELDSLDAPAELGALVETSLNVLKQYCQSIEGRDPKGPKARKSEVQRSRI